MDAIIRARRGGLGIIIFPGLDMVVVFTGENNTHDNYMGIITEIDTQFILPAVK